MKLSVNHKLIKRNKNIAQYTLYIALALLIIGFIWTIRNDDPSGALRGYLIVVPAYFLVQFSIFMANRWGSSPRPDEILVNALKGLNNNYFLYVFTAKVPYLLVGPMGIWILSLYHQKGDIEYDQKKGKYVQKNGPNVISRYFGQEGLPNVIKESKSALKSFQSYLADAQIQEAQKPKALSVFFSKEANIKSTIPEYTCLKAEKLKSLVRRESKNPVLTNDEIKQLVAHLPQTE